MTEDGPVERSELVTEGTPVKLEAAVDGGRLPPASPKPGFRPPWAGREKQRPPAADEWPAPTSAEAVATGEPQAVTEAPIPTASLAPVETVGPSEPLDMVAGESSVPAVEPRPAAPTAAEPVAHAPDPVELGEAPADVDSDAELELAALALALGETPPIPPGTTEPWSAKTDLRLTAVALPLPPETPASPDTADALVTDVLVTDALVSDAEPGLAALALALETEPPIPSGLRPDVPAIPDEPESATDVDPDEVEVPAAATEAPAIDDPSEDELYELWAVAGDDDGDDRPERWVRRRVTRPLGGRWVAMRRGERVNVVLYVLTGVSILAMTLELLAGPDAIPTEVTTAQSGSAAQTAPTVKSTTTVTFTLPQDTEPAPAPVVTRAPSRVTTPVAPVDEEPAPDTTEEPTPTTKPPATTPPPTTPPSTATTFPRTFPTPVPPVPPTFVGPTVPTVTVPSVPSP